MESGTPSSTYWRKCTTCKTLIGFGKKYWICSVSTCNRQRTGLVFCDIRCFDAHVPVLNHRDAGAFERVAPTQAQAQAQAQAALTATPKAVGIHANTDHSDEILVVASKVKGYIRARSGMNTSDSVMDTLSQFVRKYSDHAIQNAEKGGRKTVFDRDF